MANLILRSLCARGKDVMSQNQDTNDEGSTSNQNVDNNSKETDLRMEKKLRNWSMPKFRTNQIYKTSIFESNRDYMIKKVENEFVVQDSYKSFSILDSRIVNQHLTNRSYFHFGLVQVSAKPLTRLRSEFPILICLRDKRLLRFRDSVTAVLESNLQNGPAYFNCFPSYPVSIEDPHCTSCLVLDIKIPGEKFKEGIPRISIMYRFCYKVLNSCLGSMALNKYTANETEVIEVNAQNSSIKTRRRLKHDEVTYPEEWLQECSSQPQT